MPRPVSEFGFTAKGLMTQIKRHKGDLAAICKALDVPPKVLKAARRASPFADCDHKLRVFECMASTGVAYREANRVVWYDRVSIAMANANNKRTDAAAELHVSISYLYAVIKRDKTLLKEFGLGSPGGDAAHRRTAGINPRKKVATGASNSLSN